MSLMKLSYTFYLLLIIAQFHDFLSLTIHLSYSPPSSHKEQGEDEGGEGKGEGYISPGKEFRPCHSTSVTGKSTATVGYWATGHVVAHQCKEVSLYC